MGEVPEKRTHRRYTAKERAFALLKPYCDKLGQIKDISLGGLSFEYLDVGAEAQMNPPQKVSIDIIMTRDSFYLSQLPCEIVYDEALEGDSSHFVVGIEARRCGLHFSNLDTEQKENLERFIKKHAYSA